MKVIFLDIDGVVNTHLTPVGWVPNPEKPGETVMTCADQEKVFMLNNMVDKHGFKVVLSSSWRMDKEWRATMKANGFIFEFLGSTPDFYGRTSRGTEIQSWLEGAKGMHPPVEGYAIIDDNADMLAQQKPNFFKTQWGVGLTQEIADAVEAHLLQ